MSNTQITATHIEEQILPEEREKIHNKKPSVTEKQKWLEMLIFFSEQQFKKLTIYQNHFFNKPYRSRLKE